MALSVGMITDLFTGIFSVNKSVSVASSQVRVKAAPSSFAWPSSCIDPRCTFSSLQSGENAFYFLSFHKYFHSEDPSPDSSVSLSLYVFGK